MAEKNTAAIKYELDAILESKKYRDDVDIIRALCTPGKKYTIAQIDKIISDFKEKEV